MELVRGVCGEGKHWNEQDEQIIIHLGTQLLIGTEKSELLILEVTKYNLPQNSEGNVRSLRDRHGRLFEGATFSHMTIK